LARQSCPMPLSSVVVLKRQCVRVWSLYAYEIYGKWNSRALTIPLLKIGSI
jgi:hypothetical protein